MEDLTLKVGDGVATLTLNRPEKKNALSEAILEQLPKLVRQIEDDRSVRVVILKGAGGDFSAGIDLNFLQSMLPKLEDVKAEMTGPKPNFFQKPALALAGLRMPVIAVIEGVCIGAGLQLALGADLRIAHPDARLSIMEAKWGLIPDMGISQFLPKLMRADHAKELMMTARMISAVDAQALGLVSRIAEDPEQSTLELAQEISGRSPGAVEGSKALVDQVWGNSGPTGLELEGRLQADLIGTPNQMEAIMAGMTKRAPKFK